MLRPSFPAQSSLKRPQAGEDIQVYCVVHSCCTGPPFAIAPRASSRHTAVSAPLLRVVCHAHTWQGVRLDPDNRRITMSGSWSRLTGRQQARRLTAESDESLFEHEPLLSTDLNDSDSFALIHLCRAQIRLRVDAVMTWETLRSPTVDLACVSCSGVFRD